MAELSSDRFWSVPVLQFFPWTDLLENVGNGYVQLSRDALQKSKISGTMGPSSASDGIGGMRFIRSTQESHELSNP
jgi:hypothetical protein